jgi:poly-gamma-glutamate synthesis protein (capsule biosynthesis protein)
MAYTNLEGVMKRIAFTGDLGFSSKYFRGTYDKENLLDKAIVEYLSDTDHTVVNVEGSVSNAKPSANKPLLHANPPECVPFLKKINGNIWALANNHTTDCGREGVESTLSIAKENGIQTVGLGLNIEQAEKTVIIENDGADIGIIALTYEATEQATENSEGCVSWRNYEKISEMISKVKESCRWCVVVVHGGPEFCQLMPPAVRKRYKKYLKLGADVVIGHHPHVVQNYEKIGDKIIFYSLGNFVFDTDYQRLQKYTDYGVCVKISFFKDHFTWDHRAFKIQRENQTIIPSETPDIFTNVTAGQYALLWPLAMRNLYLNERVKFSFIKPKMKDFSKWQWFKFYVECRKASAPNKGVNRGVISGNILYCLNLWRFGNKRLQKYIKAGHKK